MAQSGWLDIRLDDTTNDSKGRRLIDEIVETDELENTGKICPKLTIAFQDLTECIGEKCQMWDEEDCGLKNR